MARLPRKHVPLSTRCLVASRMLGRPLTPEVGAASKVLKALLCHLAGELGCQPEDLHLDHDPALENREKVLDRDGVVLRYIPDELDPDHLIYRDKHSHHIKTNVSGEHGQYADNVIAKRERRRKKKMADKAKPKRKKWVARTVSKDLKWARRTFPKGRKLQSRGFGK